VKDLGHLRLPLESLDLVNLPVSIIGAYIWESLVFNMLLLLGSGVGLLVAPILLLFIKEPRVDRKELGANAG